MSDKKDWGLTNWDHKEQININELNDLLKRAGFEGSVNEVVTSDDQNCIVVSPVVISDDEAQDKFEQSFWEETE